MEPLKLAQTRYATKRFDSQKQIAQEKIDELKKILHLAPSSINIQPWKFHFIQNPEIKTKLAEVSMHNTEKIKQANLLIVFSVADDLDAFQNVVDTNLPEGLRDWYNHSKEEMPETDLRVWLSRQVYIALGIALSATIALGLDSTPMEGIESDKYMEILNMKDYKPLVALAVGYHSEEDYNHPEIMPKSRRPFEDVIVTI